MKNGLLIIYVSIFLALTLSFFSFGYNMGRKVQPTVVAQVDTLSEWQMLQMAIIFTESKGDPKATGRAGDAGLYQIMPIYVADVNRILGAELYAIEDAYDPIKSLYMFSVVQDHYNPEHDLNKAIKLHNPGGAAIGYPQKVKQNMEFVKRMEAVRAALKDYELRKGIQGD